MISSSNATSATANTNSAETNSSRSRKERDPFAERQAIERLQVEEAAKARLCPRCGSALIQWAGSWEIWCKPCHQQYSLTDGELQPRTIGEPQPKPKMRELYAIHEKR